VTPKSYPKLIQSGPNHETPNKIYTKYYSAQVLNPKIREQIKQGKKKNDDFSIDPLRLTTTAVKFLPTILVTDIFLSDGKIIIRHSISEAFVTSFESKESESLKLLSAQGITYDGPDLTMDTNQDQGTMHTLDEENDKSETLNDFLGAAPSINMNKFNPDNQPFGVKMQIN